MNEKETKQFLRKRNTLLHAYESNSGGGNVARKFQTILGCVFSGLFLANPSHPRYFTNWNPRFPAEVSSCNLVQLLRNVTRISNDLIVTFWMVNISAITNNYQRNTNKYHCWERRKTDSNFIQAIKGVFVTIKSVRFPNILIVFDEKSNLKDLVNQRRKKSTFCQDSPLLHANTQMWVFNTNNFYPSVLTLVF